MTIKTRPTHDDIGLDEQGQPITLGADAGARSTAIVEHPDAKPLLMVAEHNGELGVRVFGKPDLALVEALEAFVAQFRQAVELSLQKAPRA